MNRRRAAPGVVEVLEVAEAGYALSCYAAAIRWTPGDNTREWLDELRRQIEHVQAKYAALAALRATEGEEVGEPWEREMCDGADIRKRDAGYGP